MREKMPVAFVLSGGGSLGAVQVGMLRALYEHGIVPDLLVATSVGAVNAAFIASRPQSVRTADDLAKVWLTIQCSQVFPRNFVTGLLGFVGLRNSMIPSSGLRSLIEKHIEFSRLEDAPIQFHVIAVEMLSGDERRLSRGDAINAVLASAAIPAVFPPVRWGQEDLIDGGVANNAPISHAIELGADEVYVLPAGYTCDLQTAPRSALGIGLHALNLLIRQRLVSEIAVFADRVHLIVLPPPCPLGVSPADFSQTADLIERSLQNSRKFLDHATPRRPAVPSEPEIREFHERRGSPIEARNGMPIAPVLDVIVRRDAATKHHHDRGRRRRREQDDNRTAVYRQPSCQRPQLTAAVPLSDGQPPSGDREVP
jgi:NTE family protein